jgi:hypothetical protein
MLGNHLLEEEHQQALPAFHAESAFEPVVEEDAGVPPGRFRCLHGFFPQSWEKEPFPKKIKRLSSKSAFQASGRPKLSPANSLKTTHFTQLSDSFA